MYTFVANFWETHWISRSFQDDISVELDDTCCCRMVLFSYDVHTYMEYQWKYVKTTCLIHQRSAFEYSKLFFYYSNYRLQKKICVLEISIF